MDILRRAIGAFIPEGNYKVFYLGGKCISSKKNIFAKIVLKIVRKKENIKDNLDKGKIENLINTIDIY